ncbi:hypothetical protein KI387_026827 [Taxus chinensis]|uniref:Uncharacterized protein n=1 Tax=Taxus chinensis TaxID=29808 RepID=A0AA38FVB0_TAXCH|nr:hypothetical protein KI387_026827 [Taxus chinensis]
MDVSEPLEILSTGEIGIADPLPHLSISTATAQDCCSTKTASDHTPVSFHKEQKEGGIMPTMEKKTYLTPSGSEEKEILPFVREEACIKEDMRVFEPLESLPTGEKGNADPLPYLSISTVTEQVCYNHTPVSIHKEQEEGEITPTKEKEDPDSGFTLVISKKKKKEWKVLKGSQNHFIVKRKRKLTIGTPLPPEKPDLQLDE